MKNPSLTGPIGNKPPVPKPKTPKPADFRNYEKALKLLDDSVEDAIDVFRKGLKDTDKWYRFNCASVILRKVVPDRKIKEVVGDKNRPISIEFTDRREAIIATIDMLDDMDLDDLLKKAGNGSNRILEAEYRAEGEKTGEMEAAEGSLRHDRGTENETVQRQGDESLDSSEAGLSTDLS